MSGCKRPKPKGSSNRSRSSSWRRKAALRRASSARSAADVRRRRLPDVREDAGCRRRLEVVERSLEEDSMRRFGARWRMGRDMAVKRSENVDDSTPPKRKKQEKSRTVESKFTNGKTGRSGRGRRRTEANGSDTGERRRTGGCPERGGMPRVAACEGDPIGLRRRSNRLAKELQSACEGLPNRADGKSVAQARGNV